MSPKKLLPSYEIFFALSLTAVVILLVGLWPYNDAQSHVTEEAPLVAAVPQTPLVRTLSREELKQIVQQANTDNKAAGETGRLPSTEQLQELHAMTQRFTPQEALSRFRTARNNWAIDSRMNSDELNERLGILAKILWGDDAEIPEETEEDRQEQSRLKGMYADFGQKYRDLKTNNLMTREERATAVRGLLRDLRESAGETGTSR